MINRLKASILRWIISASLPYSGRKLVLALLALGATVAALAICEVTGDGYIAACSECDGVHKSGAPPAFFF